MPTHWEVVCSMMLGKCDAPREWVAANNDAEEYVRRALQFKLLEARRDPLVHDRVEAYQLSFYTYFLAYSVDITAEIFRETSPLFPYQKQFRLFDRDTYLWPAPQNRIHVL